MFKQATRNGVVWSDGTEERVDAIIFATGFKPNINPVERLGVLDEKQRVKHHQGASTTVPGLYFVRLPKQRNFASATLRGVSVDAGYITERLVKHLQSGALRG